MAYAGDSHAAALLFSEKQVLTETDRLTAALVLAADPGSQKGDLSRLQTFLDSADPVIRTTTLNALMLMELADPGTSPERCITCLSSSMPLREGRR